MEVTFKVRADFLYVLLKLIQENRRLRAYDSMTASPDKVGMDWEEFTLSYGKDVDYQELSAFVGACFSVGLITKGEFVSV